MPRNIDVFNRMVATCLLRLYEAFPVPQDINAINLAGDIAGDALAEELSKGEAFDILMQQSGAAIQFLAQEGFLRYRDDCKVNGGCEFPQAQLTMKGLAILGKVPDSLADAADRRSLADRLRDGLLAGAEEALRSAVSSVLSAALCWGWQTVAPTANG